MAHAIGLHRGMGPARGGWVGPALLFITGIGLLAAGTFPLREDAAGITYDPGGHTVAGMIFFLGSPAALIVLSRRMPHDPSWRGLAPYTLGSGLVFLDLAIVGMVFASPAAAPLHDWAGLVQRIMGRRAALPMSDRPRRTAALSIARTNYEISGARLVRCERRHRL